MTTRTLCIPGSLALLLATMGLASAQQVGISGADVATQSSGGLSLTAGADYSTGKYGGTSSTDILYAPFTGKYEWDRWTFKLTVPFISVTGPGNVVRGVGIVRNKVAGPRRTESGVGDVIGSAAYTVFDGSGSTGTLVDVAGKIKFGTADASKGLGTGENDYAPELDIQQTVTAALTAFGSLGYDFVGSPAGANLNDVLYGSVGGQYKFPSRTAVGAIFYASEAISNVSGPQRDLTAYIAQPISDHFKLQLYGLHGFANGSPDWAGGLMATLRF